MKIIISYLISTFENLDIEVVQNNIAFGIPANGLIDQSGTFAFSTTLNMNFPTTFVGCYVKCLWCLSGSDVSLPFYNYEMTCQSTGTNSIDANYDLKAKLEGTCGQIYIDIMLVVIDMPAVHPSVSFDFGSYNPIFSPISSTKNTFFQTFFIGLT